MSNEHDPNFNRALLRADIRAGNTEAAELQYRTVTAAKATERQPLATRLRVEAAEWDDGETVPALLLEAAEAIEEMAGVLALQAFTRAGSDA